MEQECILPTWKSMGFKFFPFFLFNKYMTAERDPQKAKQMCGGNNYTSSQAELELSL